MKIALKFVIERETCAFKLINPSDLIYFSKGWFRSTRSFTRKLLFLVSDLIYLETRLLIWAEVNLIIKIVVAVILNIGGFPHQTPALIKNISLIKKLHSLLNWCLMLWTSFLFNATCKELTVFFFQRYIEEVECQCVNGTKPLSDGTCTVPVMDQCVTCSSDDELNACVKTVEIDGIRGITSKDCDKNTGYSGCWVEESSRKNGTYFFKRGCGYVCTDSYLNNTYCYYNQKVSR